VGKVRMPEDVVEEFRRKLVEHGGGIRRGEWEGL
jgi:hypothetical protein